MNSITGRNKVTEKDEEMILKLCHRGVDDRTIADVTGWSTKTVQRIRRGKYHEIKEAMRVKSRNKRIGSAEPAAAEENPEAFEQTCIHVGSYDTALGAIIRELAEIKNILRGQLRAE